jgi:hypothetical protein
LAPAVSPPEEIWHFQTLRGGRVSRPNMFNAQAWVVFESCWKLSCQL